MLRAIFLVAVNSICFGQQTFIGRWIKWIDRNKSTEKHYSVTLQEKNGKLSRGRGNNYSPKEVDLEMSTVKIIGNTAIVKLKSDQGGPATVKMTLRGNKLYWKTLNYKPDLFFSLNTVFGREK